MTSGCSSHIRTRARCQTVQGQSSNAKGTRCSELAGPCAGLRRGQSEAGKPGVCWGRERMQAQLFRNCLENNFNASSNQTWQTNTYAVVVSPSALTHTWPRVEWWKRSSNPILERSLNMSVAPAHSVHVTATLFGKLTYVAKGREAPMRSTNACVRHWNRASTHRPKHATTW